MSATSIDRDPDHLYPAFREKIEGVMESVLPALKAIDVEDTLRFAETLRTQERQSWLYSQGRSRPGSIVTWIRSPRYHGCGLAADLIFAKRGYSVPRAAWKAIKAEAEKAGLCNPAWSKGDYGHVQWDPADKATRQKAIAWVRGGFKQPVVPPPTEVQVAVYVDGRLVPDADAYLQGGRIYLWVRSIADEINAVILTALKKTVILQEAGQWDDVPENDEAEHHTAAIPLFLRGGRGFIAAANLRKMRCLVDYNPAKNRLDITTPSN